MDEKNRSPNNGAAPLAIPPPKSCSEYKAFANCQNCHQCQNCHNLKTGNQLTLNPARLNPIDSVDFCGACHRTSWDVRLGGMTGISTVRFQPYRLEKSRCWGKGDARLTCMVE